MRRQEADERGRNCVGTSDCSEYPEAEQRWKSPLSIIRSQNGLSGEVWKSYQKT